MSDDTGELAKLLARLDAEGHGMEEHPPSERLSAYQADELPPEEQAVVKEHLESCSFCRGRVHDLERLLSPLPEDLPVVGIADFETAAEWRRLQRKLEPLGTRPRRAFATLGYSLAAVLAVVLGWASYRIAVLERQLATPITDLRPTTFESPGSRRGNVATPQPFHPGNVAVFETHSDYPFRMYRLIFRDETGRIRRSVEDREEEDGTITLLLPQHFLRPGLYHVEVVGLAGGSVIPIRDFEVRILP